MLKSILIKFYLIIISTYKYYKYYKIHNILIKVKVIFKKHPQFNQRIFLRGSGSIKIGENCCFGFKRGGFHYGGSIELQARTAESLITIGNNVNTNNNVFISSSNNIKIGDDTLIGQNVSIMDFEAHGIHPDFRKSVGETGSVNIGNNVWIGNNVVILKDTAIGNNSIVAAGAVVRGEFPANVIIGGIPAKVIKEI